jgi:hypothetical protein
MSIVSPCAPQANSQSTELPTTCDHASVEVADDHTDERSTAPQGGSESRTRSPTGIRTPPNAREYISGYEQLSKLGVGFYPIHRDKSPAVEDKLNREVTTDLVKIRFWAEYRHYRSFALRILKGSLLMVVDTESPFKHPGKLGPDGEMVLYGLLEDHDITLPRCPMVQTASGGFHRYFLVPKWLRIRSVIGLWPGIDILAVGSSVILPGSQTEAGQYCVLRSFEECVIPEAPREFIKLIRKVQQAEARPERSRSNSYKPLPESDTSVVSGRQWWLLLRNRVFRSCWSRKAKAADTTDSAYEYHLAKACFCCGLNQRQTEFVIMTWRQKHGLTRSLRQLRDGIVPGAWQEVSPWVAQWRADRAAAEDARKATKTSSMILSYISNCSQMQTPASIASALPIPRERAKKTMQRMAKDGKLRRTKEGYAVGDALGTFSRITTPL